MKILDLPLKKEWYEMIESGEKREEYRECKDYWYSRLIDQDNLRAKPYTHVRFRYGYTKRTMLFDIGCITIGVGNPDWGAPKYPVFIIKFHKPMQYIDKSAVVAEIERRLGELSQLKKASYEIGLYDAYKIVLSFLDTLELKEVDLEKEIEMIKGDYEQVDVAWNNDFDFIARHFFELGLITQKGGEV